MTTFRVVATLCIVIGACAIILDLRRRANGWSGVARFLERGWKGSREIWGDRGKIKTDSSLGVLRRMVYLATFISFALLATTAFVPVLLCGGHLTDVFLVIHVTIAPFFALALAGCALLWSHRLRFRSTDWHLARRLARGQLPDTRTLVQFLVRAGYWVILLCSLPLMLSIILEMYPLFGTDGLESLIQLHGYSALILLITTIAHAFLIMTYAEDPIEHFVKEEQQ
jgi:hypothetical protein